MSSNKRPLSYPVVRQWMKRVETETRSDPTGVVLHLLHLPFDVVCCIVEHLDMDSLVTVARIPHLVLYWSRVPLLRFPCYSRCTRNDCEWTGWVLGRFARQVLTRIDDPGVWFDNVCWIMYRNQCTEKPYDVFKKAVTAEGTTKKGFRVHPTRSGLVIWRLIHNAIFAYLFRTNEPHPVWAALDALLLETDGTIELSSTGLGTVLDMLKSKPRDALSHPFIFSPDDVRMVVHSHVPEIRAWLDRRFATHSVANLSPAELEMLRLPDIVRHIDSIFAMFRGTDTTSPPAVTIERLAVWVGRDPRQSVNGAIGYHRGTATGVLGRYAVDGGPVARLASATFRHRHPDPTVWCYDIVFGFCVSSPGAHMFKVSFMHGTLPRSDPPATAIFSPGAIASRSNLIKRLTMDYDQDILTEWAELSY